jgi:hypothetical protein
VSRKKLKRGAGLSDPTARFVKLQHYLLKSRAWRSMPAGAKALLLEVWARHNGSNNGEISFACSEAPKLVVGMCARSAARYFDILVDRGFLVVVRESSFDRKKIARTWRLTGEPAGGEPATKDFMRWRPDGRDPKFFPSDSGVTHSDSGVQKSEERAATVTPESLKAPESSPLQRLQSHTYNIPCVDGVPQLGQPQRTHRRAER